MRYNTRDLLWLMFVVALLCFLIMEGITNKLRRDAASKTWQSQYSEVLKDNFKLQIELDHLQYHINFRGESKSTQKPLQYWLTRDVLPNGSMTPTYTIREADSIEEADRLWKRDRQQEQRRQTLRRDR